MRPHLYKRPCPSVGPSVGWSVMLSSKSMKNGLLLNLMIKTALDEGKKEGHGLKEEGGMRRKERTRRKAGRGGRMDGEEQNEK